MADIFDLVDTASTPDAPPPPPPAPKPEVVRTDGAFGPSKVEGNHISVMSGTGSARDKFGLSVGMGLAVAGSTSKATFQDLAETVGLDYGIREVPVVRNLYSEDNVDAEVPVMAAYYKDAYGRPYHGDLLGVVGRSHAPLSPLELWQAADELAARQGMKADRVFSRDGGTKMVGQFDAGPIMTPKGEALRRVTMGQGVAGNGVLGFGSTLVLVVCQNTALAAFMEACTDGSKSKHVGDIQAKLAEMIAAVESRIEAITAVAKRMEDLDRIIWHKDKMVQLAEVIYPDGKGKKGQTRAVNQRTILIDAFGGAGAKDFSPGADGKTALDAYQAITWVASHKFQTRDRVIKDRDGNTMGTRTAMTNEESIIMGSAGKWQAAAVDSLMAMVK